MIMKFLDFFNQVREKNKREISQLENKIQSVLPKSTEQTLIFVTCLAGLLSRVAYIDFEIHKNELSKMENIFSKWTHLTNEEIVATIELALSETKTLAGLENHLYCHPLNEILDNNDKYLLLESLFQLAASDGQVSLIEEEEIRLVANSLRLENKHFIAARAHVLEKLSIFLK